MGLFESLTKNSKSNNFNYGNVSRNNAATKTYRCTYCGKTEMVADPRLLPRGGSGCRSRGKGADGRPLDHDWRQL